MKYEEIIIDALREKIQQLEYSYWKASEDDSQHADVFEEQLLVPRRLLESLLDNTREYRAQNSWWRDEKRRNYQSDYQQLCDEIKEAEDILSPDK